VPQLLLLLQFAQIVCCSSDAKWLLLLMPMQKMKNDKEGPSDCACDGSGSEKWFNLHSQMCATGNKRVSD